MAVFGFSRIISDVFIDELDRLEASGGPLGGLWEASGAFGGLRGAPLKASWEALEAIEPFLMVQMSF